jgi:Asp-tRNA(Asn)/Glu-tRNA(Gln) amidotransferase A subunit family amidase
MGATVADVCLLDAVVNNEPVVAPKRMAGVRIAVPADWLAAGPPLAAETKAALDAAVAALEQVGASVFEVDGMVDVKDTGKETWEPPLPVPMEDNNQALQGYLDAHGGDLPAEMRTVAQLSEQFGGGGPLAPILKAFYAPNKLGEDELASARAEVAGGVERIEAAYRRFFRLHGLSAVLMPCFPQEPTRLDANPMGTILNEGAYASHLTTFSAPSMVLPTPGIQFAASGCPTGVMLLGVEDRELLGVGLALEGALAGK